MLVEKMSESTAEEKKKYRLGFKAKKKRRFAKWAIFFYQQKSVDSELENKSRLLRSVKLVYL
jgi:hypothetical protein